MYSPEGSAMSAAGQDTLINNPSEATIQVINQTAHLLEGWSYQQMDSLLQEHLRQRMSAADLKLITDFYDRQRVEYADRLINEIAPPYRDALICQRHLVDSLFNDYVPRLAEYRELVNSEIGPEKRNYLDKRYDLAVKGLRRKREENLAYDRKINIAIDSTLFNYYTFNFNLMEYLPNERYYGMVGAGLDMNRIPTTQLAPYFELYQQLDDAFIAGLDKGCRAHIGLPAYHDGRSNLPRYSQANALYYAHLNLLPPAEQQAAVAPKFTIDTSREGTLIIDDIIDRDALIAAGFVEDEFYSAPGTPGFTMKNAEASSLLLFMALNKPEHRKDILRLMSEDTGEWVAGPNGEWAYVMTGSRDMSIIHHLNGQLIFSMANGSAANRDFLAQYFAFFKK